MSEVPAPPAFPSPTATPPASGSAPRDDDDMPDRIGPPRVARALNFLAFAAMAAAIALVAIGVAPAALSALGIAGHQGAAAAPYMGSRLGAPPPRTPSREDAEMRAALERMSRSLQAEMQKDAPGPGDGLDERDPFGERADRREEKRAEVNKVKAGDGAFRYGTARRDVFLLEQPGDIAHSTGMLRGHQKVTIVREQGEWLLVFPDDKDPNAPDATVGWTRKSEIAPQ